MESSSIQASEGKEVNRQYRLGVALSGGGARGFAHAGALMAIEEAGLKPDVIAGVSAGSVVAVLYAAGVKPQEIPQLFAESGFSNFARLSLRKGGIFNPARFREFILRRIAPARRLEELKMPVFLGVTDFDNAQPVEFHSGEIGPRMIASCSIPLVFPPVEIDGTHYVDGGVMRNHPAWIIRDKCQFLIGVNCSPMPGNPEPADSFLGVTMRTYHIMLRSNQFKDMAICDLSIETPELSRYKVFDLKNITSVFTSGYIHARHALRKAGLWNTTEPANTTES